MSKEKTQEDLCNEVADSMKTKEQERPDGYVAWHESGKIRLETFKPNGRGLTVGGGASQDCHNHICELIGIREVSQLKLLKEGWKVRPVKLLFLDEGKCKKE